MDYDVIIVGGGAAGFFAAANIVEQSPHLAVLILEQSKEVMGKVKISGGGRCNVTNSIWEAGELIKNYPRGSKELLGPFSKFGCGDTMAWYEDHGVSIKIEDDGRAFPESNDSQSIIHCLMNATIRNGVKLMTQIKVQSFGIIENGYEVITNSQNFTTKYLTLATGSSNFMWEMLKQKSYLIVPSVPSLFTFNTKDPRLNGLMGIAVDDAKVSIDQTNFDATGPLLITHWGLSGPGILRLSAWAAQELAGLNYQFTIKVNWCPSLDREVLNIYKTKQGSKTVLAHPIHNIPIRLWKNLLAVTSLQDHTKWADLNKDALQEIFDAICKCQFIIKGKSTFKEEFVTAGGVDLKEINFSTFESRKHPNLFMIGEMLNIDAITGGFNFQAAWTGAWLVAKQICSL